MASSLERRLAGRTAPRVPTAVPDAQHLERLRDFDSIEELLEAAGSAEMVAVRPRLRHPGDPGVAQLPGEPGYDAATGVKRGRRRAGRAFR